MVKKYTLHILFLGCVFFTFSCKFNEKKSTNNFDAAMADTLSYDLFSIDTTDASCTAISKNCPNIKIEYPIFNTKDSSLNIYLNNEVLKSMLYISDTSSYAFIQDIITSYFKENKDDRSGKKDEFYYAWQISNEIKVHAKIGNYITLEKYNEIYEGGAHPNSSIFYDVYDITNRKKLNIEDVLNIQDTALLRIGEHYFRKDNNISDTSTLADAIYFIFGDGEDFEDSKNYGKFHFNNNFAFSKDGIEFLYNTYEIAPYAVGAPTIVIPYSKIKPFLKITIW
jgi:hypothetical protein